MAMVRAPDHSLVPVKKADQRGVPGMNSANPPPISIGPTRLRGTFPWKRDAPVYRGNATSLTWILWPGRAREPPGKCRPSR
jgi:hypothetical protein